MDTRRMAEYLKLCESMNFTRAARELHLSQSALSKHVSQIENEVGAALIAFVGALRSSQRFGKTPSEQRYSLAETT